MSPPARLDGITRGVVVPLARVRVGPACAHAYSFPTDFPVYDLTGIEVGVIWRDLTRRWRCHRYGYGATLTSFPSQDHAAQSAGWLVVL